MTSVRQGIPRGEGNVGRGRRPGDIHELRSEEKRGGAPESDEAQAVERDTREETGERSELRERAEQRARCPELKEDASTGKESTDEPGERPWSVGDRAQPQESDDHEPGVVRIGVRKLPPCRRWM